MFYHFALIEILSYSEATYVSLNVAEYSDYTPLTAPSTVHLIICTFTQLSATWALCGIIITVISVSTVYFYILYRILFFLSMIIEQNLFAFS